jgi:tRNA-dihydrouridine synthase
LEERVGERRPTSQERTPAPMLALAPMQGVTDLPF